MRLLVFNLKGGAGKTTTAVTLADLFSSQHETLLVDLDSQASATHWVPTAGQPTSRIEDLLTMAAKTAPALPTLWSPRLALAPTSAKLAAAVRDMPVVWRSRGPANALLALATAPFATVVMDCHPNRSLLTVAALRAATHVVVPTPLEPMAIQGLAELLGYLREIKTLNPKLRLSGVLPVAVTRSRLTDDVTASLARTFGPALMPPIRRTVRVAEAFSYKLSLHQHAPTSTAAEDYTAAWRFLTAHPEGFDVP